MIFNYNFPNKITIFSPKYKEHFASSTKGTFFHNKNVPVPSRKTFRYGALYFDGKTMFNIIPNPTRSCTKDHLHQKCTLTIQNLAQTSFRCMGNPPQFIIDLSHIPPYFKALHASSLRSHSFLTRYNPSNFTFNPLFLTQ